MNLLKKFIQGPLTRFAIANGHHLVLALGRTWRIRHDAARAVDAARRGNGPVMYVFTHGVLLALAYTHRRRAIQILISESRDGEIITRISGKLGFGASRGSSTRGGERAVLRLAAKGRAGYDLAITPDGPKGPRGTVGPGPAIVAARSGVPIVPVGVAADRAWRARSWDRFLIPKPGARVWVTYGAPIHVRRGEERLALTERVERAMADVEASAQRRLEGVEPPQGPQQVPA